MIKSKEKQEFIVSCIAAIINIVIASLIFFCIDWNTLLERYLFDTKAVLGIYIEFVLGAVFWVYTTFRKVNHREREDIISGIICVGYSIIMALTLVRPATDWFFDTYNKGVFVIKVIFLAILLCIPGFIGSFMTIFFEEFINHEMKKIEKNKEKKDNDGDEKKEEKKEEEWIVTIKISKS